MFVHEPISSMTSVGYTAEVIRTATAPVFMLAGIGAFLNVCALRLARIVDRAREIEPKLLASKGEERGRHLDELRLLDRRMGIVNWGISLTVLSAALICAVVVLLFADPFIDPPLGLAIAFLFIGSISAIGVAFVLFLVETHLGARAVQIRDDILMADQPEGG